MVKKFPSYYIANYGQRLYCFRSATELYKIEVDGSATGERFCVDRYRTRAGVLKHGKSPGKEITAQEFETKYRKLIEAILSKML